MVDSWKKKMMRRRTTIRHKAYTLLKMVLLLGRKGGVLFKLGNLLYKHLKTLTHYNNNGESNYLYRYGERQLSFDETPLFNVKKKKIHRHASSSMRFLIPCIAPHVDFNNYEFDDQMDGQDCSDEVRMYGYDDEECDRTAEEEEKGVDVRAEEFIAKFYEQIKLQSQISYLEY